MNKTVNKAQEVQNKIHRDRPMTLEEQNEFYRNMSGEQKLKITFWFMDFGHKLEKKEDPRIVLQVDAD